MFYFLFLLLGKSDGRIEGTLACPKDHLFNVDTTFFNDVFYDCHAGTELAIIYSDADNVEITIVYCSFAHCTGYSSGAINAKWVNLSSTCIYNCTIFRSDGFGDYNEGIALNSYMKTSISSTSICKSDYSEETKTKIEMLAVFNCENYDIFEGVNISENHGRNILKTVKSAHFSGEISYCTFIQNEFYYHVLNILYVDGFTLTECNFVDNSVYAVGGQTNNFPVINIDHLNTLNNCYFTGEYKQYIANTEITMSNCYFEFTNELPEKYRTSNGALTTEPIERSTDSLFATFLCHIDTQVRTYPPEGCPALDQTPEKRTVRVKVVHALVASSLYDSFA